MNKTDEDLIVINLQLNERKIKQQLYKPIHLHTLIPLKGKTQNVRMIDEIPSKGHLHMCDELTQTHMHK